MWPTETCVHIVVLNISTWYRHYTRIRLNFVDAILGTFLQMWLPRRGIEPQCPTWQGGILTNLVRWIYYTDEEMDQMMVKVLSFQFRQRVFFPKTTSTMMHFGWFCDLSPRVLGGTIVRFCLACNLQHTFSFIGDHTFAFCYIFDQKKSFDQKLQR